MTGVVKFWHAAGWGIITPHGIRVGDREREVFIHVSKLLPPGTRELSDGQEVEYSLLPGVSPPKALSARPLGNISYVSIDEGRRRKAAHGTD